MITAKIKGTNELFVELEARLGKEVMKRIGETAVKKGAEIVKDELNASIGTEGKYAKGWTVEDTTISDIEMENGIVKGKIHWNGPHKRYRIVHLNEWGTVKLPKPPRKGAIARGLRNSEKKYRDIVKKSIEEGL